MMRFIVHAMFLKRRHIVSTHSVQEQWELSVLSNPTDPFNTTGRRRDVTRLNRSSQRLRLINYQRSEEHTSELQSRFDLVCRLLLEKKNKYRRQNDSK